MPAPILQVKRGALSNLPGLRAGEPAFTTDTFDFFVGIDSTTGNNKFLGSYRYWSKETVSKGSGINLVESTGGSDYITLAAPASVGAAVTYTFPSTITDGYFLKTNSTGELSWAEVVSNFFIAADSGSPDLVSTGSTVTFSGGSNINTAVTDNTITINLDNDINVSGIITASAFSGSFSGNATSADEVKTVSANDANGTYYITFVNSNNGSATNETVYTDDGVYYNPGTNTFTTQHASFTGNVNVSGIATVGDLKVSNYLYDSSNSTGTNGQFLIATSTGIGWTTIAGISSGVVSVSTRAQTIDTTGTSDNATYYVTFVDTSAGQTGETLRTGTALSLNASTGNVKSAGDLSAGSGYLSASDGTRALYMYDTSGDVSFQGKAIVNQIRSSTDSNTLITLSGLDATFARDINVTGIATASQFSGNLTGVAVTATSLVKTPDLNVTNIKAFDGTTSVTISNTTGAVGFANSVTINGDLYVIGNTTQVETTELKVQDAIIDLGLVQSGGVLVPPSSDLNIDIGILLNWYDSSAKKAAVYWDDSAGRIGIASDVSETLGVLTANAYAAVEIGALWVNDCAGQSQVISCTGSERFLNNITVDAGTF